MIYGSIEVRLNHCFALSVAHGWGHRSTRPHPTIIDASLVYALFRMHSSTCAAGFAPSGRDRKAAARGDCQRDAESDSEGPVRRVEEIP